jgi:hypothetical protein
MQADDAAVGVACGHKRLEEGVSIVPATPCAVSSQPPAPAEAAADYRRGLHVAHEHDGRDAGFARHHGVDGEWSPGLLRSVDDEQKTSQQAHGKQVQDDTSQQAGARNPAGERLGLKGAHQEPHKQDESLAQQQEQEHTTEAHVDDVERCMHMDGEGDEGGEEEDEKRLWLRYDGCEARIYRSKGRILRGRLMIHYDEIDEVSQLMHLILLDGVKKGKFHLRARQLPACARGPTECMFRYLC